MDGIQHPHRMEIYQMRKDGVSLSEVGKKFDLSPARIRQISLATGNSERNKRIEELLRGGVPDSDILQFVQKEFAFMNDSDALVNRYILHVKKKLRREATALTISLTALYESNLPDGGDNTYVFDDGVISLYNHVGDLCCLDGETVAIISHENGRYLLRNDNGESSVYFSLTDDEVAAACFH